MAQDAEKACSPLIRKDTLDDKKDGNYQATEKQEKAEDESSCLSKCLYILSCAACIDLCRRCYVCRVYIKYIFIRFSTLFFQTCLNRSLHSIKCKH